MIYATSLSMFLNSVHVSTHLILQSTFHRLSTPVVTQEYF